MAGGMLGLRTVTLDNHEVFLLARWNIHNFKVTIFSLINYHHPSQKYWREINGIGHGRLTDQVRRLINEGIQTSGQGGCPGTTAPWTSTPMLAPPQLSSISLVPGTKKKSRFTAPPSQTMSAHRNFFMHNCVTTALEAYCNAAIGYLW